jgi:hypothetical protein
MKRIASETWQQIKTAHASGIGLREIARKHGHGAKGAKLGEVKPNNGVMEYQGKGVMKEE